MRRVLPAVLIALLIASCSPTADPLTSPPSPQTKAHVFIIVMENKSPPEALGAAYTGSLAKRYALLTNYHAVSHPSLPNYLALTSGSTWGIRDDGFHPLPAGGIGVQLTSAGVSWRAYMEGMSEDCLRNGGGYAVKHDPFAYYGAACPPNVVPFDQLRVDLESQTPQFVWISPNLCNDTHDCPLETGDTWLGSTVPQILASPAWKQNSILFIVWDEDDNSGQTNAVASLVIAPHLKAHTSATPYNHYSLLATIEDRLGVGRLGHAADAQPIDLVTN